MEKLTKFDVAEYLDTDELQTLYLDEVAKENDPAALIKAIDTVARADTECNRLYSCSYPPPKEE